MGMHDTSKDEPAHASGTRKGEEISQKEGKESREEKGASHAGRPAGKGKPEIPQVLIQMRSTP